MLIDEILELNQEIQKEKKKKEIIILVE